MNPLIETLNHFGQSALRFAWPMLWQSSLLIAVLFTADFTLRRHVRAAVRHALWLVLLVKLLLPPSLALPTSLAWWLFPTAASPVQPQIPHFVVSYGNDMPSSAPTMAPVTATTPGLAISIAAWTILGWSSISLGLLVWLIVRWWQVTRQALRATPAPAWLSEIFDSAKRSSELRRKVNLRITDRTLSPAVCGLIRPVILLPQPLVETLSSSQLRAVLLHELTHLRRGDVWMNCAQALVQIVYWWHPLLWLANARICRVREEAVDDAVMLALRGDAEIYAPTLLEVAKLAFHRPLASLGLVGILESRSALRQRIERLVNFRAPSKAGLTLASFCGICIFSAVALPMDQAPVSAGNPPAAGTGSAEQSLTVKVDPVIFIRNVKAQAERVFDSPTDDYTKILLDILRDETLNCAPPHGIAFNTQTGEITTQNTPEHLDIFRQVIEQLNRVDGRVELPLRNNPLRKGVLIEARIYRMSGLNFKNTASGLQFYNDRQSGAPWWSVAPENFKRFVGNLESSGLPLIQRPRILTRSGLAAEFYVGDGTNSVDFNCKPLAAEGFVDLRIQGTTIARGAANSAFTNYFNVAASAEDGGGIVIRVENFEGHAGSNLVVVINLEIVTNNAPPTQFRERLTAIINRANENATTSFGKTTVVPDTSTVNAPSPATVEQAGTNGYARTFMGTANSVPVTKAQIGSPTNFFLSSPGRKTIYNKLNRLHLDAVSWPDGLPLSEALRVLSMQAKLCDPEKKGISFWFDSNAPAASPLAAAAAALDPGSINVKLKLTNMTLAEVLDAIVLVADRPIQYSIQDDGVVFSARGPASTQLETRTFKVDKVAFLDNFGAKTNVSLAFKQLITNLGLDFSPPKAIYFNETRGLLYVRATRPDLDTVEKVLTALNFTPLKPQIHIKARFIELPPSAAGDVYLGSFDTSPKPFVGDDNPQPTRETMNRPQFIYGGTTGPTSFTGIMTDPQFRIAHHALRLNPDAETLAEPEVTTLSGLQTRMRATEVMSLVTNFVSQETGTNLGIMPQQARVEVGPVLDTIASVLSDGYTIDLTAIASLTEFLGYDTPTNSVPARSSSGENVTVPTVLPRLRVRQVESHVKLWDGQTVVLGNLQGHFMINGKEVAAKPSTDNRIVLVLITVNLVDAAGNRVHSDDEVPFAKDRIPPQDSR